MLTLIGLAIIYTIVLWHIYQTDKLKNRIQKLEEHTGHLLSAVKPIPRSQAPSGLTIPIDE